MGKETLSQIESESEMPGPYKIVAATSFGVFLSALDSSIINVSLVTIQNSLGVVMSQTQWIVVAYLLVITSIMPLMGKFGDRFGKTLVFQSGMLIFITGSLLCALSTTLPILVGSRILQAVGASMMTANGLALVTYYTTPKNRGRAIGLNSIVLAAALGLGPVLGGILTEFFGWQSIFLINIPIGIVGFFIVKKLIPETEKILETSFDTVGAALFFVFLFSLVYLVSVATETSLSLIIVYSIIIIISLMGFIYREQVFCSPIIPTKVLADRRISTSIFSAIFAYMAMVSVSYLIPYYLQEALEFSQSATGIFLVSFPLVISVAGPVSGWVSERMKAKYQTIIGLFVEMGGLILLGLTLANIPMMVLSICIMSFGLSLFTVSNGNFIMTSAPKKYMGVISALTNISRTTGFSIGIAAITAVFGWFFSTISIDNPSLEYALRYEQAVQSVIFVFSLLIIIGIIISAFRGLSPAEQGEEPVDEEVCITPERE
ncbi:MAG: MFS transporter [Candidatus Lokiarchaeota archaeon]|nr:MFS transporter [Candidatus Lokiarchaeota archaeon]